MKKEFEVISDVIGNNNKIVKADIIYKKVFELDNIEVEQFISNRGQVVKKYCTVLCENKFYKVNSPYEYVLGLLTPTTVKGFYSKSNRYEKDQKRLQSRRNRF